MELIVDFQFLKDKNNLNSPKEVAIVDLNHNFCCHWIIKPKTSIKYMESEIKKNNNWLKRHHHGLEYNEGEADEQKVYDCLRKFARNAVNIYVRGNDKWLILHKITGIRVINLEYDTDCPSFKNLSSNEYCIHHSIKKNFFKLACALNNAYRLKNWLKPMCFQSLTIESNNEQLRDFKKACNNSRS